MWDGIIWDEILENSWMRRSKEFSKDSSYKQKCLSVHQSHFVIWFYGIISLCQGSAKSRNQLKNNNLQTEGGKDYRL